MPDDPDDAPAELSELDLSEDAAITGEDMQESVGVEESSVVKPNPNQEEHSDADDGTTTP